MRLINADDLVKIFHREGNSDAWGGEFIRRTIEEQPAIEAVPLEDYRSMEQTVHKLAQALAEAEPTRHGKWIKNEGRSGWHCSCCGKDDLYAYPYTENNERELQDFYCPNCGARIDEVEE